MKQLIISAPAGPKEVLGKHFDVQSLNDEKGKLRKILPATHIFKITQTQYSDFPLKADWVAITNSFLYSGHHRTFPNTKENF